MIVERRAMPAPKPQAALDESKTANTARHRRNPAALVAIASMASKTSMRLQ
jgi:hypothetical protein